MPLLHRVPFSPADVPSGLDPKEKVYYCEPTGEIFRNFEEYFERRVLLDTEVWSCSITGKSNLTFDEAVESESQTRRNLTLADSHLVKSILYLFSKATGRVSVKTLALEIHEAIKEIYFIGEIVTHQRKKYKIKSIKKKTAKSPVKKDSDEENKSPQKLPAKDVGYEYHIEECGNSDDIKVVNHSDITRKLNYGLGKLISYTIKVNAKQSETNRSWAITPRAIKKYRMDDFEWSFVFPHFEPKFEAIIPKELKKKTAVLTEVNKNDVKKQVLVSKEPKISDEEKRQREELERNEKRRLLRVAMKEWSKLKPDESLDDFKKFLLHAPKVIKSRIPAHMIGDAFQVIEFYRIFGNAFGEMQSVASLKNLTLRDMENALFTNSSSGTFCDMLFFYIQALRYCIENERNEANISNNLFPYNIKFLKCIGTEEPEEDNNVAIIEAATEEDDPTETAESASNADSHSKHSESWPVACGFVSEDCIALSTECVLWSVKCLGRPVNELQVDEVTTSEVLRMTILTMGSEMVQQIAQYRRSCRVGWDNEENPFILSLREQKTVDNLKKLETESIFDFEPEEKLWFLTFLTDALLSQNDGRQVLDDAEDEMKLCRKHVAEGYKNEKQRGREFIAKVDDLQTKVKDEEISGTPTQPTIIEAIPSVTRSKRNTGCEYNHLTYKEELAEAINENSQLKLVHEDNIYRLNEKHTKLELTMRSQLLGLDRFYRRYWLTAQFSHILVEVPPQNVIPPMADGRSWEKFKIPKQLPKPSLNCLKVTDAESDEDNTPLAGLLKRTEVTDSDIQSASIKPENDPGMDNHYWSLAPTLSQEERWFVYDTKEDYDKLLASLNERGEREKELKSRLEKFSSLLKFAAIDDASDEKIHADQLEKTNYQHMLLLRDYLLDIEERIFHADFGDASADEKERDLWRSYWEKGDEGIDVTPVDFYEKIKNNIPKRIPLPIHLVPQEPSKEIRNLAAATLLLARAIKRVFLCRPMTVRIKKNNSKSKKKTEGFSWKNMLKNEYNAWEQSLMTASSASSIYLHIIHLDECIDWDKSPENIRCFICKKKSNASEMLICDDCDKGYHMYCHKPKVKWIPDGDWFCKECAIKQRQASSPVKKRRRTALEDEDIDGVFISDRPRKRTKVNYAE